MDDDIVSRLLHYHDVPNQLPYSCRKAGATQQHFGTVEDDTACTLFRHSRERGTEPPSTDQVSPTRTSDPDRLQPGP